MKLNPSLDDAFLKQFLVRDFFDNLNREIGSHYDLAMFCREQEKILARYGKSRFFLDIVDRIFLRRHAEYHPGKKRMLFRSVGYPSIMEAAKKNYQVGLLVQGKEDRKLAWKNDFGYASLSGLYRHLISYQKDGNAEHLRQLVEEVEKKIRTMKSDVIVMRSDAPPLERAIVLAAKNLGIPTVSIQHGFYASSEWWSDCRAADYILVWGNYIRETCLKLTGRKLGEVFVLGYPYGKPEVSAKKAEARAVCYLGQPYERYGFGDQLSVMQRETVREIAELCRKSDLGFIYRPHPSEDRSFWEKEAAEVRLTHPGESLSETFEKTDIFISFSSTALSEAFLQSKIALQLINFPLPVDNFEALGIATKSFATIDELGPYVVEIANAKNLEAFRKPFNRDYMETEGDVGKRFLEIISDILTHAKS